MRGEHVICKWVLDLDLVIGDNSEWSDLRTGTRSGWDADGVGLDLFHVEEFWELVHTLADVHEAL